MEIDERTSFIEPAGVMAMATPHTRLLRHTLYFKPIVQASRIRHSGLVD
jgi:hypothetical protein